jgi:hypothetical protein
VGHFGPDWNGNDRTHQDQLTGAVLVPLSHGCDLDLFGPAYAPACSTRTRCNQEFERVGARRTQSATERIGHSCSRGGRSLTHRNLNSIYGKSLFSIRFHISSANP